MGRKRTHTIAHLTKLCSTKVKFKFTDVDKYAFMKMNKIVRIDIIPS